MAEGHTFDPTILREYDIRGIVPDTLGPEDVRAIGRAFATILLQRGLKTAAVGYEHLSGHIIRGFRRQENGQRAKVFRFAQLTGGKEVP